ncbi:MAG: hypothetical protein ACYS21_07220 [Planctomycetota bacterium]|jgi:hypothetical protein
MQKRHTFTAVGASALLFLCSCNSAIKTRTVQYEYLIEVEAYGPKDVAEKDATLTLKWPKGSKVVPLPGRKNSHTVTIPWTEPSTNQDLITDPILFYLGVEVKKPGYAPWRAALTREDFFKRKGRTMIRTDKVTLHQVPANISSQIIEQLSLTLPCGLDVYTTRAFLDVDGDGSPEAVLYRQSNPSASRSPLAEIRVMSLREGKWVSMFLANHQGVFISGQKEPDSSPAPRGYTFSRLGAHKEIIFEKLHPLGKAEQARTYVWGTGKTSFEVLRLTE